MIFDTQRKLTDLNKRVFDLENVLARFQPPETVLQYLAPPPWLPWVPPTGFAPSPHELGGPHHTGVGDGLERDGTDLRVDEDALFSWTGLHTFGAHVAFSAVTSYIRMNTDDGADSKRIALCGGGGFVDTRGGSIWLGGNEYPNGEGEISLVAGNVTGGDIKFWTAGAKRLEITHAGVVNITVVDNAVLAMGVKDVGGLEYLRIVSTDAGPSVVFNDGGADIDYRWEAYGEENALFIRGSDGKIGIWASTLNARVEIGGTPGPAILNLPTNLSTIDAGLSTRSIAGESIVMFGTNVDTSYTGRVVAAKAGALIRCDTRDQDGGTGSGNRYTIFQVITRAGGGSYTVPLQIAAGAPTASLWIKRTGVVHIGEGLAMADGAWQGIGPALERIVFNNAGDISVLDATLIVNKGASDDVATFITSRNVANAALINLYHNRGPANVADEDTLLLFYTFADSDTTANAMNVSIRHVSEDVTHATRASGLAFYTQSPGAGAGTEKVRITGVGYFGVGCIPNSPLEIDLATENFEVVDAGSAGASEQDWIKVEIGGVQGYIRVFATE